jgi:hypothetical protein
MVTGQSLRFQVCPGLVRPGGTLYVTVNP